MRQKHLAMMLAAALAGAATGTTFNAHAAEARFERFSYEGQEQDKRVFYPSQEATQSVTA
eukprot:gene36400-41190_t